MALTTNNLSNGGKTTHYQFQWETLAGAIEPARTNAVLAACEGDFSRMSGWFANIALDVDFPIPVNVTQNAGGASWSLSGRALTVTINPGAGVASVVRYLIVSEMVEQFMRAQGKGWFGAGTEGSQGEGLSRFLAARFLALNGLGTPPGGFDNSNAWLRSARADFVNKIKDTDDGPDDFTGCSLLFIYYLFSQLGFSIEQIVGAAAGTLGGVYRNLTGTSIDPFPHFKQLVDSYFPGTATITGADLDNPFPLKDVLSTPAEIVWHNNGTNETQIWFYDGHRVVQRGTVLGEDGNPALVGPPWHIVGAADFSTNGKKDILWHNSSTNETQIWFMDHQTVIGRATVLGEDGNPALVGPPWHIVGAADFSGDGKADILWHNSATNETQIWFMDHQTVIGRATVLGEDGNPALVGPPWHIVGAADFSGDGKADILWHNSATNETQIWFMDHQTVIGRATVLGEDGNPALVGPPWHIVGAADFSGDGKADILWHNSATNETQIWFMDHQTVIGRATVLGEDLKAAFVGPPWHIVGAGHLYVDASSDILWHNSQTNDTQFWFMNGPQIRGRNGVVDEQGNVIQVGDPWHIAGVTGLADETAILWHNSQTNDTQFWFMNGPQIRGRNGVVDEQGNVIQVGDPWHIAGVTGLADETAILWHNSQTNDTQFWFMNGPQIRGRNGVVDEQGNVIQVGDPWHIAGVTGLADETAILWHNSQTNDTQFWFMNGPQIRGRNGVVDEQGNVIQVGDPWHIAGVTGLADETAILWHNSQTNDTQFWFMNGPQIRGRNGVVDEQGNVIQVGDPWHIAGTEGV